MVWLFAAWCGMRSILISALMALAMSGTAHAQGQTDTGRSAVRDWTDPDLGGAVLEGVATRDSLWLLGASGNVVRFDRLSGERLVAANDVSDVLVDGPHLWALVKLNDSVSVVRDLRDPALPERRIRFEGAPLRLFATPDGPGILTTAMVLHPSGERWDRRRLAALLEPRAHVSALTGNMLFVGYNKGEWGGGLRRVDVTTGAVSIVQDPGDRTCGGRLDPECDPVVGIISDAESEDCVLVGSSLAHLGLRSGEILRVCGAQISLAFADPLPGPPNSTGNSGGQTWAFDSLVETSDGWIAVEQDRYARARGDTVVMGHAPVLRPWAGLEISDPVEGVIFVKSACCWGSDTWVRYGVVAIPVQP